MPSLSPRVLYIDDDAGLARLVQKALQRRDYIVEHAQDGETGLAMIAQGGIDVVALDHYLPGGTGLDVLNQLVGMEKPPAVVYVTGTNETAVAVAALKAGAADYVLKTVDEGFIDLLVSAIDAAVELLRLNRARLEAEREMRHARERAEMLLGEVNHRVANSLAMVAALVGLQANALHNEEARSALSETQMRIQAIAGVHRHLYTSDDVRSVHIADYLQSLVSELQTTLHAGGTQARVVVNADNIALPTEKAASIGVIVTELVTNAVKYAYVERDHGEVRILISRDDNQVINLSVEDDGIGWDGTGKAHGTGLGSRIVKAMAHGLGSQVIYATADGGTRVTLQFTA
jgi:two-component sensor histidine kinase